MWMEERPPPEWKSTGVPAQSPEAGHGLQGMSTDVEGQAGRELGQGQSREAATLQCGPWTGRSGGGRNSDGALQR